MENFFLVGRWDASHIWCQWDDSGRPDKGWQVRLRTGLRWSWKTAEPNESTWTDWLPPRVCQRDWFCQALNLPSGSRVQAQIQVGDDWITASEATFIRSLCRFEIRSDRADLHYIEGTQFVRPVDGAPCAYRLPVEIEVKAGGSLEVELEAVASHGWAQLDAPGDFLLRPALGVVIRNLEPSRNNLRATGRDFTVLEAGFDGPPVTIAVNRSSTVK